MTGLQKKENKTMFKNTIVTGALSLAMILGSVTRSTAQEAESTKSPQVEKQINAYRLDFSVNELEDGKKINTRQYSMNLNSDNSNELKIGTRVPVESKQGEFQYL